MKAVTVSDAARGPATAFDRRADMGDAHNGDVTLPADRAGIARRVARGGGSRIAALAVALAAASCTTTFDNAPLNAPVTPEFVAQAGMLRPPEKAGGEYVIALSLSGGGLRAAAFSFGVLQALRDGRDNGEGGSGAGAGGAGGARGTSGVDVFDDLTFISSVSGGSLTAAYFGLHGRAAFTDYRSRVLERNLELDLRMSMLSPANIARLLAGGLNDRSNLAHTLHRDVFGEATFAQLQQRGRPDVWINASDLYNRTPFPFIPPVFLGLCSDLSSVHVADAVAASMAVPLVFAPIVLQTHPQRCLTPLPEWSAPGATAQPGMGVVRAVAQALRNYRDPARMRFVKLVDGGITDNNGLSSILIARAVSGTPHGPLEEGEAVRARRILFLVVDAGRPPAGEWALQPDGPSGVDVAMASADTAVDSASRLGADAFARMVDEWRASMVKFRCSLDADTVRRHRRSDTAWRCDDLVFEVGVVALDSLGGARAERMKNMPTRLALPKADIDEAIAAGRDATRDNPAFRRYLQGR
jgi:NTE family protein